jgi:hypothetical protein
MQDQGDESSIDGEITGFLQKHGIVASKANKGNIDNVQINEHDIIPMYDNFRDANEISDILPSDNLFDQSEHYDSTEVLMPGCVKLNKLLTNMGYKISSTITPDTISMESRSVSIFVVDSWAESLFVAVADLFDRLNLHQSHNRDNGNSNPAASSSSSLPSDVLNARVADLQEKMLDLERREKLLKHENHILQEQSNDFNRKYKTLQSDTKTQLKLLDQKNQVYSISMCVYVSCIVYICWLY